MEKNWEGEGARRSSRVGQSKVREVVGRSSVLSRHGEIHSLQNKRFFFALQLSNSTNPRLGKQKVIQNRGSEL